MPWLWIAAAVAFSPSLADLLGHALELPRDRLSFVVATILFLRAAFLLRGETPAPRQGAAILLTAVVLQFFGILGDASTLQRLSVSLALVGVARFSGRPPRAAALLALWMVPIPVSLLEPFRAVLENAAAAWVATVAGLLAPAATAIGPVVRLDDAALELHASDAGIQLAHLLSSLGWYAAALRGERLAGDLRRAALFAVLGLLLAFVSLAVSGVAFVTSGPALARGILDPLVPTGAALAGFVVAERGRQRPV